MIKKTILTIMTIHFLSVPSFSEIKSNDEANDLGFPIILEELEEAHMQESELIPEPINYCEEAINTLMSDLMRCTMELDFPIKDDISSEEACEFTTPPYDNSLTVDQHAKEEYIKIIEEMQRANCVPEQIFLVRLSELHNCLVNLNSKRASIKIMCELLYPKAKITPRPVSSPSPVASRKPLYNYPLLTPQRSPSPIPSPRR